MGFKVGDRVVWRSQAAGTWRVKRGEVVEVVPAGHDPQATIPGRGFWRDKESYVVRATPDRPKARPQLYWPRTSALKAA